MIIISPAPGIAGSGKATVFFDINSVADTPIGIPFSKWRHRAVLFHSPSVSLALSVAIIGLFTAPAGGGTNLITSVVTTLVSATDFASQTLLAPTTSQSVSTIYLRPTVANGSAATLGATIFIDDLT